MADDATTTPVSENDGQAETWKAPASQDELNRIIESRLARERAKYADFDSLKEKAEKYDELKAKDKSEIEKATERATAAESKLASETLRADRAEIALEKGLTLTQAKRLVGTTRAELEADADQLVKDLKIDKAKLPRAREQGMYSTTPADDPMRDVARTLFKRGD